LVSPKTNSASQTLPELLVDDTEELIVAAFASTSRAVVAGGLMM
jgi:hypothetical protein